MQDEAHVAAGPRAEGFAATDGGREHGSEVAPDIGAEIVELEDPWEAFLRTMWFGAGKTAGDRAFAEILGATTTAPRECPGKKDLVVTVGLMMERAIAAGKMRADLVIDDIPLIMCGIGSASALPHPCSDAWRRHLGIVLDGMRAEATSGPLHG